MCDIMWTSVRLSSSGAATCLRKTRAGISPLLICVILTSRRFRDWLNIDLLRDRARWTHDGASAVIVNMVPFQRVSAPNENKRHTAGRVIHTGLLLLVYNAGLCQDPVLRRSRAVYHALVCNMSQNAPAPQLLSAAAQISSRNAGAVRPSGTQQEGEIVRL